MRKDRFTDEALRNAYALAELKYSENPEDQLRFSEAYDFARCQRPDGSFYGTSGQCRKGKQAGDKPAEDKSARSSRPAAAIESDMRRLTSSGAMQAKGLAGVKARAEHARLKAQLAEAKKKKSGVAQRNPTEDVRRKDGRLIGTSPRNMRIDARNELVKERDDYRKKFGGSSDEMVKKVLAMYEKRIELADKWIDKADQ
jgi:hypothetical protein